VEVEEAHKKGNGTIKNKEEAKNGNVVFANLQVHQHHCTRPHTHEGIIQKNAGNRWKFTYLLLA